MSQLTWIRSFNTVAELGSFTQAADKLELSPQLVSKYVAQLEQQLGAQLIQRTTRRLHLTETGQAYFERSQYLLEEFDALEDSVHQSSSQVRGRLKINAPMSFGIRHLAKALADFETRHPEVIMDLVLNDREVDLIEEGFDLALRIAKLKDSSLIAKPLAPIRLMLCASPDYLAQHGTPHHPQELTQHHCLRYSVGALADGWQFEKDGQSFHVKLNSRLSINNGDALTQAALAGTGLVLQPTFIVADAIEKGLLVPLLTEYQLKPLNLYAVYPSRRHLSARVRCFVDFLAGYFTSTPYWDQKIF